MSAGKPIAALLLGCCVLLAAAWLRGFEYDEAYSVFVTAGTPRPAWPEGVFRVGDVHAAFTAHAGPIAVLRALRTTDVHPPLYFWTLAAWRRVAGDGIFALRLLSVLCAIVALALVWAIARHVAVPAGWAVALTACSYGFAYTGSVARGFALADALSLSGVLLVLIAAERGWLTVAVAAGLLLGAAGFTNYLAVFVGGAAILWLSAIRWRSVRLWLGAAGGFVAFVPADLWFFLAQRGSRAGQFPPFRLWPSVIRLARDAAASLFGGLPLYVNGAARIATSGALGIALTLLAMLVVVRWRRIGWAGPRALVAMAAAAPAMGLLLLGVVFDTTPIELRYLCFAVPFVALLIAGTLTPPVSLRETQAESVANRAIGAALLGVQLLAVVGLAARHETMQPARAAAKSAATLAGTDGLVLLPRGNDGVGVVGPFLAESPGWLRLRLVPADADPTRLRAGIANAARVVLATVAPDTASRAAVSVMRATLANGCWRETARSNQAIAYERVCPEAETVSRGP